MLGESHEEENEFLEDLPKDRRLNNFNFRKRGLRLNIIRDNIIVTLRELNNGTYACIPFSNTGVQTLYCMTEKEQGYKMGYHIVCNTTLRKTLMNFLRADIIFYYSEIEYNKLKIIIEGD